MPDFRAKMHQKSISAHPAGGAYSAPPDPLAGFRGLLLRGGDEREGEGKGGEMRGGEGREEDGREGKRKERGKGKGRTTAIPIFLGPARLSRDLFRRICFTVSSFM